MFFNKKKKAKVDPKVRFQNRQFNQKLQQARTFKRTARSVPENSFERMLNNIGLGSKLMQIAVALLVLGILYIVYAPNFLTVKSINVEGLSTTDNSLAEAAIRDSLGNAPFYNPQRNLLLLSKRRTSESLQGFPSISNIEKISKNYNDKSLNVFVKPKTERFLIRTGERVFDIYNDGTIKNVSSLDRASWETTVNPNMIKVDVVANIANSGSKDFLSSGLVQYITELNEDLKAVTGSTLAYVEILMPDTNPSSEPVAAIPEKEVNENIEEENTEETNASPEVVEIIPVVLSSIQLPINVGELNLVMQKGLDSKRTFKVMLDTKESPKNLVSRLNLLLSQTAQDRYNNLSYIDLRIQSRAFVCLLDTPCNVGN
jgi:hypothetical protein